MPALRAAARDATCAALLRRAFASATRTTASSVSSPNSSGARQPDNVGPASQHLPRLEDSGHIVFVVLQVL